MYAKFRHSLQYKLFLAAVVTGAALIAASAFSLYETRESTALVNDLMQVEVPNERHVLGMVSGFKKQVQEWKNVLIRGHGEAQLSKYWGKFEAMETFVQEEGTELLDRLPVGEAHARLDEFLAAHRDMGQAYRKGRQAFIDAGHDHKAGDAAVAGIDRAPTRLLEEAANLIAEASASSSHAALERSAATIKLSAATILLSTIFGVAGFVWLTRRMVIVPARRLAADVLHLSEGDFTQPIRHVSEDELGEIGRSAESIRLALSAVLHEAGATASEVSAAAGTLVEESATNVRALHEHRAETERLSTAIVELSAAVQQVAENTSEAAIATREVETGSAEGQREVSAVRVEIETLSGEVENAVAIVNRLERDSTSIGTVLDVIRNVADQTNLLALNAAIEAARAGEQGRGFAVVADEVRTLASRTQESTQEIQSMIEAIQAGTAEAVGAMETSQRRTLAVLEASNLAETALRSIAESAGHITAQSAAVASATEQQSQVTEELASNVHEICTLAERAEQHTEKTARSSERFRTLAETLEADLTRFRL